MTYESALADVTRRILRAGHAAAGGSLAEVRQNGRPEAADAAAKRVARCLAALGACVAGCLGRHPAEQERLDLADLALCGAASRCACPTSPCCAACRPGGSAGTPSFGLATGIGTSCERAQQAQVVGGHGHECGRRGAVPAGAATLLYARR